MSNSFIRNPASTTQSGIITTGTQSLAGVKQFTSGGYYGNTPTIYTGSSALATSNVSNSVQSYSQILIDNNVVSSFGGNGTGADVYFFFTVARAGYYRLAVNGSTGSTGGTTANYLRVIFSVNGTAASIVYPGRNAVIFDATGSTNSQQDASVFAEAIFNVTAAGQQVGANVQGYQIFSSGTHTLYSAMALYPI